MKQNLLLTVVVLLCVSGLETLLIETDFSLGSLLCSFGRNWIMSVVFLLHINVDTNTVCGSDAAEYF